ncbi:Putative redox-active protein (C_GCAxxG_C_C) (modular protein) [Candidatus Zixiibacteriota bacterium]|nr:Putative redox-active protein (C_GCAxxG_C_C) (modular protein) [candidate division Zixibacteria bacterium]
MGKAGSGLSSLRTVGTFAKRGTCSETSLCVLNRAFGDPLSDEERAAAIFAGGIMQHGYQCGLIWGAALAAGAQMYRRLGAGPKAEAGAILKARRLVASFRTLNRDNINCLEIIELDKSATSLQMIKFFILKGGVIGCFRRAAKFAKAAHGEISDNVSHNEIKANSAPVSCSALVAKRMGASEKQVTMAAGLAGGIGLSGGACGALGAALWIDGISRIKIPGGKINFNDPGATGIIERFLKAADYEFECAKIVGRSFENVDEHAGYLKSGGCSNIIDALVSGSS